MTNFLHWRKMTWALLAWSAAMTAWLLIGGVGPMGVGLLWFAGMTGFGLLWLATQPLFQTGARPPRLFRPARSGAVACGEPPPGLLGRDARARASRLQEGLTQNLEGVSLTRREPSRSRRRPGHKCWPHELESCSPKLLRLARHSASGDCGLSAGVLAAGPVAKMTAVVHPERERG